MNIGLFTDSYLPRRSGVVRAVEATARGLRARGQRAFVFAPAYAGHIDTDPDVYRFPSIAAPGYADFPLGVPFSPEHLRTMRSLKLDVVHSHSPFLLGGLGVWAARTLKLPLVFTYHTLYSEYAHYAPLVGDLVRPFVIAYTTAYCNRCDRILVSVPSLIDVLRHYGVRTHIEILPSVGVDPVEFAHPAPEGVRAWFRIPANAALLLFVGRLAREKGLRLLLESVAGLAPHVWLLLVGDGPERRDLEAEARRLGVEGRVVFGGEQDHAHVIDALFACDIFVFPSQTETLGLAVLEAMAAGCAVVAVRGGAIPEILRDGESGRVVPAESSALRQAIVDLLSDPERRRALGARARTAAAEYDEGRIIERLLAMYDTMVTERRGMPHPAAGPSST